MNPISLDEIEQARERIGGSTLRSPLVHLGVDDAPADIYLKLENLQPTGSFKVRGAGNAIALLSNHERDRGVYTCSAGNMAQALAWHARRNRIPCTAIIPDTAPETWRNSLTTKGTVMVRKSVSSCAHQSNASKTLFLIGFTGKLVRESHPPHQLPNS